MIDNNLNVVKHNKLTQALGLDDFTVFEQQFISACIAQISSEDTEVEDFNFNVVELYESIRGYTPRGQKRKDLYKSILSLMEKKIKIPDPLTKGKHIFTWFTHIYIEDSGMIVATINKDLVEYLIQLEGNYTFAKLGMYKKSKNTYGFKLFQIMSRYTNNITSKGFEIEELKELFNLVGKYKRPYNFKTRVLEPAIEDINSFANFTLTYEEGKTKRRVTHIKLTKHYKEEMEMTPVSTVDFSEIL